MTALGLGTAQLGLPYGVSNRDGRPSETEAGAILECALAGSVRMIDTAPAYGDAEALLGRLLPADADVRLVTKTPPLAGEEVDAAACDAVRSSAERSLKRLRRDRLDGLLLHHGSELALPGGELLARRLAELRDEGLVQQLGVSVYSREELDAARERLPLDLVQLPLNAFDQRFLRDGTLEELRGAGVEVHVRSAFLQGLLLMEPEEVPPGLLAVAEEPLRRVDALRRRQGLSRIEAALGPLRETAGVDVVVVGTNSVRELEECIAAMASRPGPGLSEELAVEDPELIDPRRWAK